jgi:hypothetical protein
MIIFFIKKLWNIAWDLWEHQNGAASHNKTGWGDLSSPLGTRSLK